LGLAEFVTSLSLKVTTTAWGVFLLAWSIGWVVRGAPIPVARLKRAGQGMIEDALWAAFWLALGSTIFSAVNYLVQVIGSELP